MIQYVANTRELMSQFKGNFKKNPNRVDERRMHTQTPCWVSISLTV
jgi:hypothetical protein